MEGKGKMRITYVFKEGIGQYQNTRRKNAGDKVSEPI